MDGALRDFLEDSGLELAGEGGVGGGRKRRMNGKGKRMEGVWVRCRGSDTGQGEGGDEEEHEDDEMIWWSWDGKLVGFSDW